MIQINSPVKAIDSLRIQAMPKDRQLAVKTITGIGHSVVLVDAKGEIYTTYLRDGRSHSIGSDVGSFLHALVRLKVIKATDRKAHCAAYSSYWAERREQGDRQELRRLLQKFHIKLSATQRKALK